jgi:hypothetical protein
VQTLKQIHDATHPARLERAREDAGDVDERGPRPSTTAARSALLAALATERDEDEIT